MPAFNINQPANYIPLGGTWMWFGMRTDIRDEGWKLHVSGISANAQTILDLVLPVLADGMVGHKFLPTTELVDGQTGGQWGKMLAVYPDSIVQAFGIVTEIDRVLTGHVGKYDSPYILNEKYVGRTVVYTRYGAYNSSIFDAHAGKYVDDSIGQIHPDWIADPWVHYPDVGKVTTYATWAVHEKDGWRRNGRK